MDSAGPFQPWATDDSAKNVKSERELVDDAKLHRENVNHPKHRQTASYDKESVVVSSNAPGASGAAGPGADSAGGTDSKMDTGKVASMQQIVEGTLSPEGRQRVTQLLEAVEALSGAERLLLYLRLPTGMPPHDPLKQPINPLGSRAELQQTVTWIQTHLEVDPEVSLPKQDVYDEYIAHCMSSNMKPLSTADFGKVMKQVYPTVRPRRLGTRGNSRYCYAGLRKKIKLEVPQLPDLGESSKEQTTPSREAERIVCDWAESKLGVKFASISEVSRHLQTAPPAPLSASPPPQPTPLGPGDDPANRTIVNQLKRKLQMQRTPGRPKKNKGPEEAGESPPSSSYVGLHPGMKHESEAGESYGYPPYVPVYEPRGPYPAYREYRAEPYVYDPSYDQAHNLPMNLSSDASLDLSEWRRRPPEPPPPPPRPLPGKKLILEAYQSEARASSQPEELPRTEYLPKKMRAAEILGGKLAARHAEPSTSAAPPPEPDSRPMAAFLEDPKNLPSRSKSTAAALAREEQEAASPTRATRAPAGRGERRQRRAGRRSTERPASPDSCCGLDGINMRTGVICEEKHSEILNRERVISICNIDKHDLDDYLNEGSSQEHEEELLQYFHQRAAAAPPPAAPLPHADHSRHTTGADAFLERGQDPQDDHSQGKNEKISQLRELLAKNLKNQSGSNLQNQQLNQEPQQNSHDVPPVKTALAEGAFKPLTGSNEPEINGTVTLNQSEMNGTKHINSMPTVNGNIAYVNDSTSHTLVSNSGPNLYNGHSHTEPQSPTTRTQQYDFVPISDGCQSPGHFNSKSPLGFGQRGQSPSKVNKAVIMGGSLQTSPISHSTAASPFVSPRNTPVPRSRLCPRPIPKHNGRKRRNPLSLGVVDPCSKQFAIPNDQKFLGKAPVCGPVKYCQPMSAPPSPNILNSQYKNHMYQCNSVMTNGNNNLSLNFLPNTPFREHLNGEQPLSADPLSSEVSQFFQESLAPYRSGQDAFRSQSVPLKPGIANMGLLSYNNTPVGSVPPTPVPNEFCDFGSLGETCDISKAGLNRETLDKIYNAIDSSSDVLSAGATQALPCSGATLGNGCDQQMLSDDHLIMPGGDELLDRATHFNQSFVNDTASDNVDDFLKRNDSMEFDLNDLVEKNKFYSSRSVPSTPLPYKRDAPSLQIDSCRSRELFPAENYMNVSNGISSKSVPSTPQFADERSVFSYSNRDFLINGNSVSGAGGGGMGLGSGSPLPDVLGRLTPALGRLTPALGRLTPALLADLDKIDPPYADL